MALDGNTNIFDRIDDLLKSPASPLFKGGRKPRKAQHAFSQSVGSALCGLEQVAMIQADTGSGKTIGYLVPAILDAAMSGRKVIISTQSIALQNQVMETLAEIVPILEKETGQDLRYARRIGKRNFLDQGALEDIAGRYIGKSKPGDKAIRRTEEWFAHSKSHLRHDLEDALSEDELSLPFPISSLSVSGPSKDHPLVAEMIEASKAADILVVNHALLALDFLTWGKILGLVGGGFDDETPKQVTLIVDEADLLPGSVRSMAAGRMPFIEIKMAVREVADQLSDPEGLLEEIAGLQTLSDTIRTMDVPTGVLNTSEVLDINRFIQEGGSDERRVFEKMSQALASVEHKIRMVVRPEDEVALEVIAELSELISCLDGVLSGLSQQAILLYWSPVRGQAGLARQQMSVAMVMSRLFQFSDAQTKVIFTSATMTMRAGPELMEDFSAEIGFSKSRLGTILRAHHAPENFGKMHFLAPVPAEIPAVFLKDDEDDLPPLNPSHARMVLRVTRQALKEGNRALVLIPAFRDATLYRRILQEPEFSDLSKRMLFDDPEHRRARRERFRTGTGLALVSPAAWIGLDMPGVIDTIILARLPIAPRDIVEDHLFEAWLRLTGRSVNAHRYGRSIARAVRKVRQGFGRGIRIESDDVKIWICDPRWPFPDHAGQRPGGSRKEASMLGAVPERFRVNHGEMEIVNSKTGGRIEKMFSGIFGRRRSGGFFD